MRSEVILSVLALSQVIAAHGLGKVVYVGGEKFVGCLSDLWQVDRSKLIGWASIWHDGIKGFISPADYQHPNIVCHEDAIAAPTHATVAAGAEVKVTWYTADNNPGWVPAHVGSIVDYMAKCDGPCENVTKTDLKFFKVAERGVRRGPGPEHLDQWASNDLVDAKGDWTMTVPKDLADGDYIWRTEIINIANIKSEFDLDGAQHYPQCYNLKVTGGGNLNPEGIPATSLYTRGGPGLVAMPEFGVEKYVIPGPSLFDAKTKAPSYTSARLRPQPPDWKERVNNETSVDGFSFGTNDTSSIGSPSSSMSGTQTAASLAPRSDQSSSGYSTDATTSAVPAYDNGGGSGPSDHPCHNSSTPTTLMTSAIQMPSQSSQYD